ncbi:MAG: MopE-related protein [Chitinophagales bacterium]
MKKYLLCLYLIALTFSTQTAFSQIFVYTNNMDGDAFYTDPNIYSYLGRGMLAEGGGDACPIGFTTKNFSTGDTWETSLPCVVLELMPDPFVTINVGSFSADMRISDKGPIYCRFSYSLDSGITWVDQGFDVTPVISDCGGGTMTGTWDVPDFSVIDEVFIRITGYGAIDTGGRLNVTNFVVNGTLEMIDEDGDGYGIWIDCDDTNPDIHPGATEICNDIDEDCDGITSEVTATITPTGDIYVCKHEFVTLYAPEGYAEYQWLKNGWIMPGMTASSVTTEKPGYYQVIVTDAECTDTSEVQAVAYFDNPFANIWAPEGLDLCVDDSLKLKASYGDDYMWQWYRDGEALLYENFYKILCTEPGDYYCEITTFFGCSRTTETLTVIHSCKLGDFNTDEDIIKAYPNPAQDNITFYIETGNDFDAAGILDITNISGEKIGFESVNISNGIMAHEMNVSALPAGIYTARITTDENQFATQFIISK